MKKLILGAAPLLAVMAFAVMPAMAQAETKEYGTCGKAGVKAVPPCTAGAEEFFTPFKEGVKQPVTSHIKAGTSFVLEAGETGTITCTTFENSGTVENVKGVGKSTLKLTFANCEFTAGALKGCKVANVTGTATDLVLKENEVEVKLPAEAAKEFVVETTGKPEGCPTKSFGSVTGTAAGKVKGDELTFTKAPGLKFAGVAATISGTDILETEVEEGGKKVKKGVVIN